MKKIFMPLVLLTSFFIFFCGISYATEDEARRTQEQLSYIQRQQQAAQQQAQTQRPILPPFAPGSSSTVSPTPSPHIAAPSVTTGPLSAPTGTVPSPAIHSAPSVPAYTMSIPATNMPTQQLGVPIMGNAMGRVIDISSDPSGSLWIEIKDEIFDTDLKMRVDPKNTVVVKENKTVSYRDLKIGDKIFVGFDQWGDEITANLINVVSDDNI